MAAQGGLAACLWSVIFGALGAVVTDRTIALISMWVAIGGLLVGLAIVSLAMLADFVLPSRRNKRRLEQLKHPADVWFLITSAEFRQIDFAVQDGQEHLVKELVLQSHSEYVVEILIRPRMHFQSTATIFGCENRSDMTNMPCPIEFRNPMVIKGTGAKGVPNEDIGHDITHYKQYQFRRPSNWTVGTDIVQGYLVKTEGPGVFLTRLYFIGGEVEGMDELTIRVEDTAPIKMTCMIEGHGRHQIRPVFKHP